LEDGWFVKMIVEHEAPPLEDLSHVIEKLHFNNHAKGLHHFNLCFSFANSLNLLHEQS
jgi:hypothetical protein